MSRARLWTMSLSWAPVPTISLSQPTIRFTSLHLVTVRSSFCRRMRNTIARTISNGIFVPTGLFVTNNGDIYIDNGRSHGQVEVWTPSATIGAFVMPVSASCYALFIDINNTLYCSINSLNMVIKKSLNSTSNATFIAAGNGSIGVGPITLNQPNGIFVDANFNLYVADSINARIQSYQSGQLSGTTVAGSSAPGTISLHWPTSVILDADGYLFITDNGNNRIVASSSLGFRCIVGCTSGIGSQTFQLNSPRSMAFDSYGNMYVVDTTNHRIQQFLLATNSCGR